MKSKLLLYIGAATCLAAIGAAAVQNLDVVTLAKVFRGTTGDYTLVLNSSNTPSGLSSSYQNNFSSTVKTANGNYINMSFVNAKSLDGGFAQLANHGRIYNFGSSNSIINAVNGINFTGSGSLLFKPALTATSSGSVLADMTPITISAGSSKISVPVCDYFEIEAGDSGASITTLNIYYSCDETSYDVRLLDGTYTGLGSDDYIYKLTLNSGVATFESLNKSPNVSYNGTASMSSKSNVSITVNNSTISYTLNGSSLNFVSQTGSVARVNFDRVFKVENFESYSATGQGYTNSTTKYQTSGLRARYYADYYTGSSSGEIGGSGWPIMTSSDFITYNSSKGHNGSKTGIYKFSNNNGMRYISMNGLYGVNSVVGHGTYISLWARGAYTNTNFNTNHASNTPMHLYAFYTTPLTTSTVVSARETFEFTVNAGDTWQHFEFELTPDRDYYAFGLYAKQTSGSTQYVPIDDVEIYSTSPYATNIPVTGVSLNNSSLELHVGTHSQLSTIFTPSDASNKHVTWTSSNTSKATVDSEGVVTAVATGSATITATTTDGGYTATCNVTIVSATNSWPEGTFRGTGTIGRSGSSSQYASNIEICIGNSTNHIVKVLFDGRDPVATGISVSGSSITIQTSGKIDNKSVGRITGTYNSSTGKITSISASGFTMSFEATRVTGDTFYNLDGTTSELQNQFTRRVRKNSEWQPDVIHSDRITSNANQYVSGTGALTLKGSVNEAVGFCLSSDYSSPVTATNLHFWVYNPSSSDIELRLFAYTSANFGSNIEIYNGQLAVANSWTYIVASFTNSEIYNFAISDWTKSGANLTFDNVLLLNA